MKKILLLVTGMSPQIVTETLYGLAVNPSQGKYWIPDEIHVVSTNDGLNQIRDRLFDKGHFQRLLQDYNLPLIHFNETCLHKICTEDGKVLSDLKTPEDNELAANTICEVIRNFTSTDANELHVSIAGGRKTMGFYAGYALSLYGRTQDRMSHVLVEEKFEKCNDVINGFYYPTPNTRLVFGKEGVSQDAKDAKDKIWLANIPFVRLRHHLPEKTLLHKNTFSEVVALINELSQEPFVKVNTKTREIWLHNTLIDFNKPDFAFYLMFLTNPKGYASPPKRNLALRMEQTTPESQKLADDFITQMEKLYTKIDTRTEHSLSAGMFEQYFSSRNSSVNQKIIEKLGQKLAFPYLIDVVNHQMIKGRNAGIYALSISNNQIEII